MQFRISRPAISQHLQVLRQAKLVEVEKRGREHIYKLRPEPLHEVFHWIEHYRQFWPEKMSALGGYLDQFAARRK